MKITTTRLILILILIALIAAIIAVRLAIPETVAEIEAGDFGLGSLSGILVTAYAYYFTKG